MNINDFLGIAIVGVILSVAVQAIKDSTQLNALGKKSLTIALAVLLGSAYYFAAQTVWWQTVLGVLAAASTFYSFFLKGTDLLKK